MFPQIDIPSGGPLTERDLDEARRHSTGAIYAAEACTEVGAEGDDADPEFCAWFWRAVIVAYVVCTYLLAYGWPMAWPLG